MCTRGVFQLKRIDLFYCDFGGSSKGVREILNSQTINPQIQFDFYVRRGKHPFITSSYINGFIKDNSLRNMNEEEILYELQRVRNSFGRSALQHSGPKVYGVKPSIQGVWRENLWNNYPKHEVEKVKKLPFLDEVLKQVQKDDKSDKVYHKDYINDMMRQKQWEELGR